MVQPNKRWVSRSWLPSTQIVLSLQERRPKNRAPEGSETEGIMYLCLTLAGGGGGMNSYAPLCVDHTSFCQVCGLSAKFCASYVGSELAIFCQLGAIAHICIGICGFCTEWHRVGRKLPMVSRWQFFANLVPWTCRKCHELGRKLCTTCTTNLAETWRKTMNLAESHKLEISLNLSPTFFDLRVM